MTRGDIQFVRSLHNKEGRTEHGLFLAEGEKLIRDILSSDFVVQKIYSLDGDFDSQCTERVSPKEMERLSALKSANRAVAVVEMPEYQLGDISDRLIIALDDVQNPGNLGTIVRLADWFGIRDIVCSLGCADIYNPKVVQATMGAITRVRVHYQPLVPFLEGCDSVIYGAMLDGDNIYEQTLSQEGVIVMGNEGRGVSPEVAALLTRRLYIPPYPADGGGMESLNVAISTSIICSEFRRRM